jgi:hypothetical protein
MRGVVSETLDAFGVSDHAKAVRAETERLLLSNAVPMPSNSDEARAAVMALGRRVDAQLRNEKAVVDDPFTRSLAGLDRRLHEQAYLNEERDEDGFLVAPPGSVDPDEYYSDAVEQLLDTRPAVREQDPGAALDAYLDSRSTPDPEGDAMLRRHRARRRELYETATQANRRRYGRR